MPVKTAAPPITDSTIGNVSPIFSVISSAMRSSEPRTASSLTISSELAQSSRACSALSIFSVR